MNKQISKLFSSIIIVCMCLLGLNINVFAREDHLQTQMTKEQVDNACFYWRMDDKDFSLDKSYEMGRSLNLYIHGIRSGSDKVPFHSKKVLKVTSSNEKVIAVEKTLYETDIMLSFKKIGSSVITISADIYDRNDEYIGTVSYSKKINVTAIHAPKGKYLMPQKNACAYYNMVELKLEVMPTGVVYEIYRSTKSKSGFKKVKTVKVEKFGSRIEIDGKMDDWVYNVGDSFTVVDKKGIRSNKKYYYKVRCRKIPDSSNNIFAWSSYSKTKIYYTTLQPLKKNKYSYNEDTGYGSWTKVKGAAGYVYKAHHGCFRGYNIFGERLYHFVDYDIPVKSNKIHVKYLGKNKSDRMNELIGVKPITKHNGYYYVDGETPQKSIKKFYSIFYY